MRTTVDRVREHFDYLRDVSNGPAALISTQTADVAKRAWIAVWEATGYALPIPAACTGPSGPVLYAWDRGCHHLAGVGNA